MNDHLQRALIEIYYAMAEYKLAHPKPERHDLTRARLVATMANLEELLMIREQTVGDQRAA